MSFAFLCGLCVKFLLTLDRRIFGTKNPVRNLIGVSNRDGILLKLFRPFPETPQTSRAQQQPYFEEACGIITFLTFALWHLFPACLF